jgi:C1A family cysteine protease
MAKKPWRTVNVITRGFLGDFWGISGYFWMSSMGVILGFIAGFPDDF